MIVLRDFQKKRDVILNLKRKVLERNPDEFYFNMTKTQMKVLPNLVFFLPKLIKFKRMVLIN